MSLTEGPYLIPLRNVTETVMDKTGVTPDITNLPQKIKDEMGHNILTITNLITDSGFFEDAYSTEKIKSLFTYHLQPVVKKIIKNSLLPCNKYGRRSKSLSTPTNSGFKLS